MHGLDVHYQVAKGTTTTLLGGRRGWAGGRSMEQTISFLKSATTQSGTRLVSFTSLSPFMSYVLYVWYAVSIVRLVSCVPPVAVRASGLSTYRNHA